MTYTQEQVEEAKKIKCMERSASYEELWEAHTVLLAALEAAEKELDELRGLYADMAQQLGETQTYATKLEKAGDEMRASGILRQFWSEGDAWDAARKAKP